MAKTKIKLNLESHKQLLMVAIATVVMFAAFAYLALGNFSLFNINPEEQKGIVEHGEDNPPQPEPTNIEDIQSVRSQLPYVGQNFSMVFDEDQGIYFYYIDPENYDAGLNELNTFLQQNGIDDAGSFPGLEENEDPVPTPTPAP